MRPLLSLSPSANPSPLWGPLRKAPALNRIMIPKDIHVWILRPCEYVTLHGKGAFVDVIKVRRPWDGEISVDYLGGLNIITWVLNKQKTFSSWREREVGTDRMWQQKKGQRGRRSDLKPERDSHCLTHSLPNLPWLFLSPYLFSHSSSSASPIWILAVCGLHFTLEQSQIQSIMFLLISHFCTSDCFITLYT